MCMNVDFNWTFENILNIYCKLHDFYTLPAQIFNDNIEWALWDIIPDVGLTL